MAWLLLASLAGGADPASSGAAPQGPGIFWTLLLPLGMMMFIMYLLMVRPQKRQLRERQQMLEKLKKHDRVMTSGGIIGLVERVTDTEVVLTIDERRDVRLRVAKPFISSVLKESPDNSSAAQE